MTMKKTIVMVGTAEQQLLLEFLMEAAKVQLTPEQQGAALQIMAHQPVEMTMADFLAAAKADAKGAQLLAQFIAALEPVVEGQFYSQLFKISEAEREAILGNADIKIVTAENKATEVPAYLQNFRCEIRDQRFTLVGTDMVLVMSLSRGYYKLDFMENGRAYEATCGLYITIEPADAAKRAKEYRPVPRIRFSNYLNSSADLETLHVTGNREGLRIMLRNGEIDSIDRKEGERLLAFLNELRGIKLKYVANIFGFLDKDGNDKEVITELRFPAETCNPDD